MNKTSMEPSVIEQKGREAENQQAIEHMSLGMILFIPLKIQFNRMGCWSAFSQ